MSREQPWSRWQRLLWAFAGVVAVLAAFGILLATSLPRGSLRLPDWLLYGLFHL